MQGRGSGRVRDFALYGETTGETDEFGLPVRYNWAAEYRGRAMVVYGHTPVPEPEWLNRTINIDTGCVFGGRLTALRYPETELVSVPAARDLLRAGPAVPAAEAQAPGAHRAAGSTTTARHRGRARQADRRDPAAAATSRSARRTPTAALEVMSRFAADPKWLIYLPPTMSPSETSREPGLLEHPAEAFAYYRSQGVPQVVCEEKHMGSRAVVIVCRDEDGRARALRRRRRRGSGIVLHPHRPALLRRPGARSASCSTACARRWTPPASGTSSRPTGSASTAS